MMKRRSFMRASLASGVIALAAATGSLVAFPAQAAKPIKIGFSMALSGGLAGAGKAAARAHVTITNDARARMYCSSFCSV